MLEISLENFTELIRHCLWSIIHQRAVHELELFEINEAVLVQVELLQTLFQKRLGWEEAKRVQGAANLVDRNLG